METRECELVRLFMDGALVAWVKTLCTPEERGGGEGAIGYNDLAEGALLLDIMRKIEPRKLESKRQRAAGSGGHGWSERVLILSSVLEHICACYQESLHQVIVMPLPDVLVLARDPYSERSVQELRRMLLLMLGCAVQCENKEAFIEKITQLDLETQAAIVHHIKEVTHNPENVLDLHWTDSNAAESPDQPSHSSLANRLRDVAEERDSFSQAVVDLTLEVARLRAIPEPPAASVGNGVAADPPGANHWDKRGGPVDKAAAATAAASPVESNVKLRRVQQELDEKKEELADVKQDVQRLHSEVQRLRHENSQLVSEACSARAYRDELDAAHERAERAERLSGEVARLRDRLRDADFYKSRVEELREDNTLLLEAKALLEEKVEAGKALAVRQHELERDNAALNGRLIHMETEREEERRRLEELTQDHLALESAQRRSLDETAHLGAELDRLTHATSVTSTPNSLSMEVNESASRQLLRLERENLALHRSVQELSTQLQSAQEEAQRQRSAPTLCDGGEEVAGGAERHNGYDDGGGGGGGGAGVPVHRAAPSFSILDEKLEELERENGRLAAENARLSRERGCAQKLEFTAEFRRAQQQQEAAQLVRSQQQEQQLRLKLQEVETVSERLRQENEKMQHSLGLLKEAREDRAKVDLRRLNEVDSENARLLQRALSDKLSLAMLQEELSQERQRAGRVREELGELREEMENSTAMVGSLEPNHTDGRLGSSPHRLSSPASGGHNTSHEGCRKALEGKTEQISILETQLEESMVLNSLLQEELQNVMRNREESTQQQGAGSFASPERSAGDLLAEVATLRERTVTLEAENMKLQEESGPALSRAAALTAALQRSGQRASQLELRAERAELALAEARRDADEARRARDAAAAEARAMAGLEARMEDEFREVLAARQQLQAAYLRLEEHSHGLEQSLAAVAGWDSKLDAHTPEHHHNKSRDDTSYLDSSTILNDNNLTGVDARLGSDTAVMDQYTFVEPGRRKGGGGGGWLTSTVKKLIKSKRDAERERERERSSDHGPDAATKEADATRHGTASNSSSPGSGGVVTKAGNSGGSLKQEKRSYVGGSLTRKDDSQTSGKWSPSVDERGAPRKAGGPPGGPPPDEEQTAEQSHPVKRSASLYIPRQRIAPRGQPLTGSFRHPNQHRSGGTTTSTPTDDYHHQHQHHQHHQHPSHPSDDTDPETTGGSPGSNRGSLRRSDDSTGGVHRNAVSHAASGSLGRPPPGPRGKPQPRAVPATAASGSPAGDECRGSRACARWSVSGDGSGWNRATQTLDRPRSPGAAHKHRLSLSLAAGAGAQPRPRTGSNTAAFFYAPPVASPPTEVGGSEAPGGDCARTTPPSRGSGGGKCGADRRQEANSGSEAARNGGDAPRADERADSPPPLSAEQTVWYEYGCA